MLWHQCNFSSSVARTITRPSSRVYGMRVCPPAIMGDECQCVGRVAPCFAESTPALGIPSALQAASPTGAHGPRVTLARRRPARREGAVLVALRSVRRRPRARRGARGFVPTAGGRRWPSSNARPSATACREEAALAVLRSVRHRARAYRGGRCFVATAGGPRWPSSNARPSAAHASRGSGPGRVVIRAPPPKGAPRRSRGLGTRAARVRETT